MVACSQRVGAWQPLGGAVPRRPPPPQPGSWRAAGARARAARHEQKVTSPLPLLPLPPPHRTWPCALSSLPVCRLLDPANMLQFDDFKKCYGEILYRWGLRDKRADVLKFASCPPEPHRGIGASTSHLTPHTPPPVGAAATALTLAGLSGRFRGRSWRKYFQGRRIFLSFLSVFNTHCVLTTRMIIYILFLLII